MVDAADVAVVTGAAGGLGRLIAQALADRGRDLILIDRLPGALDEARRRLEDGYDVHVGTRVCDLGSAEAVRTLGAELARDARVGALVNNAGAWTAGDQYPDAAPDAWWSAMTVNLLAPMLLTQSLWPTLASVGGAVVNVGSSGGTGDDAYASPEYGAAKAGLRRFTTSLGARSDVRVTAVVPGWIGLDRAVREWHALSPRARADAGGLVPPARVVDAVVRLIERGQPGEVVELEGDWVPEPGP
jgi:short-subunit dehydrogenase